MDNHYPSTPGHSARDHLRGGLILRRLLPHIYNPAILRQRSSLTLNITNKYTKITYKASAFIASVQSFRVKE